MINITIELDEEAVKKAIVQYINRESEQNWEDITADDVDLIIGERTIGGQMDERIIPTFKSARIKVGT